MTSSWSVPARARRRVPRWAAGAGAALALWALLLALDGRVIFTHTGVDAARGALTLAAPLMALGVVACSAPSREARWSAGALLGLAGVGLLVAGPWLLTGGVGEERLAARPAGRSRVVLVRTNCGATCDFGLRLDQEWPVLPGVVRRRALASWYPADTGTLALVGGDSVRISVGGRGGPVAVVPLRTDPCAATQRATVVRCQAAAQRDGDQDVPARAMVLRIVSSLWATAVRAALRGFPAAARRV